MCAFVCVCVRKRERAQRRYSEGEPERGGERLRERANEGRAPAHTHTFTHIQTDRAETDWSGEREEEGSERMPGESVVLPCLLPEPQ